MWACSNWSHHCTPNIESVAGIEVPSAYKVKDPSVVHVAKIINVKWQHAIRFLMTSGILIVVIAVVVPVIMFFGNGSSDSDSFEIQFSSIIENLCSLQHMAASLQQQIVCSRSRHWARSNCGGSRVRNTVPVKLPCSNIQVNLLWQHHKWQCSIWMVAVQMICYSQACLFSAHNPTDGRFTNQVYGASGVYFDQDGICLLLLVLDMSMPQKSLFMSNPELAFTSILRGNKMVTSPWVSIFDKNYTRVPVPESNP